MSVSITILLLGAFAAANGRDVVLPKKAQALLAFLIGNRGRRIARDDLAALLWSNTASEQARQSLRQSLSVLRRSLRPRMTDCLAVQADTLMLADTGAIASDVEELGRLLESGTRNDLERAVTLFRGEYLAGLSLPGEPFEDWAACERQRIADMRMKVLTNLADLMARAQDFPGAIDTARQLVALDPLGEESSRLYMRLLAASGQRGLALIEHARVERLLREELGLVPDAATRQLAERIRRGQSADLRVSSGSGALQLAGPGAEIARPQSHHSLSERATIALVPLLNFTGEPGRDHFVEALFEDIAAALERQRWPIIVTPQASAARHGPAEWRAVIDPAVRFIAAGSVRSDGPRMRVAMRLLDARSGRHLWSGRMEAHLDGSFALLDRLCAQVVAELAPAIRMLEIEQVRRRPIESLTAYELYLRASAACRSGRQGNAAALDLLRRSIQLDPELGLAHALAARCYHLQRLMGWTDPSDPQLLEGVRLAYRAVELAESDPEALWLSGLAMAIINGNMRDGRHLIDRSLALNPNNASALIGACFAYAHSGDSETALGYFNRAQTVNPNDGSQHVQWHAAAIANFIAGRYEEAEEATDKALRQTPGYPGSLRLKIGIAGLTGRLESAHAAAQQLIEANPDATVNSMRKYWKPFEPHAPDPIGALIEGWRRAGMPEGLS